MTIEQYDENIKCFLRTIRSKIVNGEIYINGIETKQGDRDLVTTVDKEVEELITNNILSLMPGVKIIGEESYSCEINYSENNFWIIDPIDATANFVKQNEDFAILLAYFEKGKPILSYIYNIQKNELFSSIAGKGVFKNNIKLNKPFNLSLGDSLVSVELRNISKKEWFDKLLENSFDLRYIGCAGLDAARVLEGKYGAYICPKLHLWDYAPLLLMSEELGLNLSDFNGDPVSFAYETDILISTKQFLKDFLVKVKEK